MTALDLLLWAKGPAFNIALVIMILGIVLRVLEILSLGQRPNLAMPRADAPRFPGLRMIVSRSIPESSIAKRAPVVIIAGYIFHVGLFAVIMLFIPHIELLHQILGVRWPGLPTSLIDALTVASLLALLVLLVHRLTHPVLRWLSTLEDYLVWGLTVLPLLTGYLAFHHPAHLSYTALLAVHILSVELLMVAFPFTKLMHAFTLLMARWYSGVAMGRKGAL